MNDYLQTKELYHHGIKGQKWGIRRYQNEDGTLTDEGRRKYGTVERLEKTIKRKNTTAKVGAGVAGAFAGVGISKLAASALMSTKTGSTAISNIVLTSINKYGYMTTNTLAAAAGYTIAAGAAVAGSLLAVKAVKNHQNKNKVISTASLEGSDGIGENLNKKSIKNKQLNNVK